MCNKKKLKKGDLCMEEGLCHWSYPLDDPKKWKSDRAACRTIPQAYIDGEEWKFGRKLSKNKNNGLCRYDCEEGQCFWSWTKGLKAKNDPMAMFRCKPKDD